ncbi:MAG TPA: Fe-Mn family superoxide dismutase [Rhizomicrobium sp.]
MSKSFDRRQFFERSALTVAATMAAASPSMALAVAPGGANPAPYDVKPMPFDANAVKGLSAKILTSHYENNYTGAVKRLNAIGTQLAALDWATAPGFVVNGLKREQLIAMNSMILHEHYFSALGGEGGDPKGALAKAIGRDFGTLDRWRAEFSAMGKAEGGGSGWVVLSYSPRDKRLVNNWAADHSMTLAGGHPILVMDMYEHAYQMDYGAKAAAYVDAFMQGISWDGPSAIFEKL